MPGPSGCGKSTLLSILGLLDTPTGGTYTLNNRAVANLTAAERARTRNREIGFIFQSFNLIGDLTVYENVELPLTYRGMKPAERRKRVEEALERVGMAHRARHLPEPALRRSAAARRRRSRGRRQPRDPAGGRADRQPRLEERRGGHGRCCRNCTARARRSRWSRTIRATPATPTAAIHLFDGRIVEENVAETV